MMDRKLIARLVTVCTFAGLAGNGLAQDSDVLEEVIVTAQHREQSVMDVPIAMDVVGGDELLKKGFNDMSTIAKIAPVVQMNYDQGVIKISMRGIGTTSNDEAQDTSVVVNVDGEYINRPNVMGIALFDMERVEVLRGPQGTLYGRNSTAGAINFITRKPGDEMGGNLSVSYGNYNAIHVDAGIDIPLGESAALRFSGFHDERDGYVKHPASPGFGPFPAYDAGRSDDNDAQGGRVSLRLDPSDALSINLAAEYAQREFTPAVFAATDLNSGGNGPTGPGCNAPGFEQVAPAYEETLCVPSGTDFLGGIDREEYGAPAYGIGLWGDDTYAIRGQISYELSDAATLTYVGGFRSYSGDEDSFLTLPVVYRSFQFQDEADTQSHELRINGQVNNVIYQFGAFYFKETQDRESGFFLPIGADGSFFSYFGRYVDSDSQSLFGQVEFPFSDTLTAVVGARYTKNDRKALYLNGPLFGAFGPDPYLFSTGTARKDFSQMAYLETLHLDPPSEDKVTWLLGLNYTPDDDTLIYGKVTTGFKAGGFDSIGAYKPETNTAFEAGWKEGFGASGQHQLNMSAFYYDYQDLQVAVLLDTAVGGQTFNAGKAEIWGLEAAGDFAVGDSGHFRASINYLNAEYKELLAQYNVFCVGGCELTGIGDLDPTTPGVQQPNFAGNTPPFSPKLIATAGYEHHFDLGSLGSITAGISAMYKSSYYLDFFNYHDGKQEAFTEADIDIEYVPANGRFALQLYAHNLGDERPLAYSGFIAAGPDDIFNWSFGQPLIYGVRVIFEF